MRSTQTLRSHNLSREEVEHEACTNTPYTVTCIFFARVCTTPYAVTSLSAAYAVCKTKEGGLGGSPKKKRCECRDLLPRALFYKTPLPISDHWFVTVGGVRSST